MRGWPSDEIFALAYLVAFAARRVEVVRGLWSKHRSWIDDPIADATVRQVIDALLQERADRLGHQLSPEQQGEAQVLANRITWLVTFEVDRRTFYDTAAKAPRDPDDAVIDGDARLLPMIAKICKWQRKQGENSE